MNKLIILLLVFSIGFLPFQASAKFQKLTTYHKTLACAEKTWKQWKKDKFCMKLLKKQYHPNPKDKGNMIWNGKSWKKSPRQCGGYNFNTCGVPQA